MPTAPTLPCAASPPPRRWVPWVALAVVAAGVGVAYWWLNDWAIYVKDWHGPGKDWRKGVMPVWGQVIESAAVAAVAAAAMAALYGLYRLGRRWLG